MFGVGLDLASDGMERAVFSSQMSIMKQMCSCGKGCGGKHEILGYYFMGCPWLPYEEDTVVQKYTSHINPYTQD